MLDDEKAARIGTFLDKLKEAADIAQENWKYEVEFRQFCQECSDEEGGEEGDEELLIRQPNTVQVAYAA